MVMNCKFLFLFINIDGVFNFIFVFYFSMRMCIFFGDFCEINFF